MGYADFDGSGESTRDGVGCKKCKLNGSSIDAGDVVCPESQTSTVETFTDEHRRKQCFKTTTTGASEDHTVIDSVGSRMEKRRA